MAPYTGPDAVPGALDYMSFSTALYGESDLWTLSVVLARDHQPTLINRHVLQNAQSPPSCSFFFFFFLVCLWPYLFVIILCLLLLFSPSTCPASPPLPHTLFPLYLLPTQCSSSPGLQRGRDKKYFFCFYFLVVIVFLHEMNKVNIFYYTEQKRYFSSPDWK